MPADRQMAIELIDEACVAGARQTLTLAGMAVAARTIVGVLLGAIAGWTQGSLVDRAVLGAAEVIAAFPTLLLAMTLILALGIRRGMLPFVVALCFVGWGEIMQYVRGQVIAIRTQPYIESAVAVGARTPGALSNVSLAMARPAALNSHTAPALSAARGSPAVATTTS